jgi:E3 ubiquitin-protein ligase EDD1
VFVVVRIKYFYGLHVCLPSDCSIFCCSSVSISQPLMKCKRVFQALINIAIEELCETADALIAPVRLGVARPTAPFSLVSSNIDAIQVFFDLVSNSLLCVGIMQ